MRFLLYLYWIWFFTNKRVDSDVFFVFCFGIRARSSCVTPCVNTSSFFDLQIWSGPISDRQIWWFFRVVFIRSGWGFDLHLSDPFFARPYVRVRSLTANFDLPLCIRSHSLVQWWRQRIVTDLLVFQIYGGKQSLASDGDDKEPFSLSSPMVMTKNRYRSSSPSDLRWLTVRRWWMVMTKNRSHSLSPSISLEQCLILFLCFSHRFGG